MRIADGIKFWQPRFQFDSSGLRPMHGDPLTLSIARIGQCRFRVTSCGVCLQVHDRMAGMFFALAQVRKQFVHAVVFEFRVSSREMPFAVN
jgi:hypothetical protein